MTFISQSHQTEAPLYADILRQLGPVLGDNPLFVDCHEYRFSLTYTRYQGWFLAVQCRNIQVAGEHVFNPQHLSMLITQISNSIFQSEIKRLHDAINPDNFNPLGIDITRHIQQILALKFDKKDVLDTSSYAPDLHIEEGHLAIIHKGFTCGVLAFRPTCLTLLLHPRVYFNQEGSSNFSKMYQLSGNPQALAKFALLDLLWDSALKVTPNA